MTKHNKKRNIGIIYELFSRYITEMVLKDDKKNIQKATKILEKRFKKGTELYKEFRLFNALINSQVSSKNKAVSIVENAKKEILDIDSNKLKKEKSLLIREINYNLKDNNFYYRTVPHYREYANLQNLFNEWRKKDNNNLKNVIQKEEKAINWLTTNKKDKTSLAKKTITKAESSKLVLNIMTEKINNKYQNLSEDQKEIIRNYAIYGDENKDKLCEFLKNKKASVMLEIKKFEKECDNKIILEKINDVYHKINSLDTESHNDSEIIKFLTISGLIKELKE